MGGKNEKVKIRVIVTRMNKIRKIPRIISAPTKYKNH
jgi:hypothetical protein